MNRFNRGMSSHREDGRPIDEEIGRVLVRYTKVQRRALKQLALDLDKPMETWRCFCATMEWMFHPRRARMQTRTYDASSIAY